MGQRHEVMEVITVRTENQIIHACEFILAYQQLSCGFECVVFRDFLVKFQEIISEVSKLKTNLGRPVMDSCT
jgi:hypothetical protein